MTTTHDPVGWLADDSLTILLFHGVIPRHEHRVRNYIRKHIDEERFIAVLQGFLRAGGVPISMEEALAAREAGRPPPPRAFAVTFDDGFANNLEVAAPILERLNIPAIFYVATDFVDRNRMSWVDRVEMALEEAPPGRLRLPWGERGFAGAEDKIAALTEMRAIVKRERRFDGDALATDVQRQLGWEPTFSGDGPLDRKLTWAQIRELADNPLFMVAGHSHTHPILSHLDDDALRWEIETSLRLLADKAGIRNRHYAYPEGLAHCYSPTVIAALRACGVACCPSAETGRNGPEVGLFDLRRIPVT